MIEWIEVKESRFDDMLCILPPASQGGNESVRSAFQVGEASDHNSFGRPVFATFKMERDFKCFESTRAISFKEFKAEFPSAQYYYED